MAETNQSTSPTTEGGVNISGDAKADIGSVIGRDNITNFHANQLVVLAVSDELKALLQISPEMLSQATQQTLEMRVKENQRDQLVHRTLSPDVDSNAVLARLPNGSTFATYYQVKGFIGRGGFSDAYLAWDDVRECEVVLKFYRKSSGLPDFLERFVQREVIVARQLMSNKIQGLVNTLDVISFEDKVCLVQENISGTSLYNRIKNKSMLSPKESGITALRLSNTLMQLHAVQLSHCDVKPLNVIVRSPNDPVLIDLGSSRNMDQRIPTDDVVISIPYSPPEMYSGEPLDSRTDTYSLAMTLLNMLVGLPTLEFAPYDDSMPQHDISYAPSQEMIANYISDAILDVADARVRSLLSSALKVSYDRRIDMSMFNAELNKLFHT